MNTPEHWPSHSCTWGQVTYEHSYIHMFFHGRRKTGMEGNFKAEVPRCSMGIMHSPQTIRLTGRISKTTPRTQCTLAPTISTVPPSGKGPTRRQSHSYVLCPSPNSQAQIVGLDYRGHRGSENKCGKSPDSPQRQVMISHGNQDSDKGLAQSASGSERADTQRPERTQRP